jgi:triphosphoribosyl-dephospho-CoA synthase
MTDSKAKRIAQLVEEACIREACAPKPGNVNRYYDFPDTSLEDFLLSAAAIVPAFERAASTGVGRIVRQATEDCRRRVRPNTNLGILLLLAPLAKAVLAAKENPESPCPSGDERIRRCLHTILQSLTLEDARQAYAAIRSANPGGLGRAPEQDVAEEPSVTLLEAMELAKDRDSIASEYATGFEITFGIGLPALRHALSQGAGYSWAIVQAFLIILARVPDTLIARKTDGNKALQISQNAGHILLHGGVFTSRGREKLMEFDNALRDDAHRLNPGTTADLTAAAVFLALLESEA